MKMDVFDRLRLVLEAGFEEIVDVGHLRIEQIEAFYAEPNSLGELVAHLAIEDGGCLGRDAVVLEQCTRTKMPTRMLPNGPFETPAGGFNDTPPEITRLSAPGTYASSSGTSRKRACENEMSKSKAVHGFG